jgi:hypothetical protein
MNLAPQNEQSLCTASPTIHHTVHTPQQQVICLEGHFLVFSAMSKTRQINLLHGDLLLQSAILLMIL